MTIYLHAAFLRDSAYLAEKARCAALPPHSLDAVHELAPAEVVEYVRIGAPHPGLPGVVVFKGNGGAPSPGAALLELEDHLWIRHGAEYLELAMEQQLHEMTPRDFKKALKSLTWALVRLVTTVSARIKETEVELSNGSRVFVSMRS